MQSPNYKPELDSLRALAITIVMLHHYLSFQIPLSGFGVMMFFTLSGYFGARSLLSMRDDIAYGKLTRREALRLFYGRRYFRILPVHLLVLGVTFLANVPYARSKFFWNITFTSNWGMIANDEWFGRFSPLWSLAVLEQFYLFFPLLVFLTPRRHFFKVIVGMIASAFVFRLVSLAFSAGPFIWTLTPIGAFDQLGCGVLLAYARHEPDHESLLQKIRFAGAAICGPLLVLIVSMKCIGYKLPYHAIYISIVACIFFAWMTDRSLRGIKGRIGGLLRVPWLAAAGRASYSAFLIHNFTVLLIPGIPGVDKIIDSNFRFVILIPTTFFIAHLMVMYIEEPFGRYRKARFRMPANTPLGAAPEPDLRLPT